MVDIKVEHIQEILHNLTELLSSVTPITHFNIDTKTHFNINNEKNYKGSLYNGQERLFNVTIANKIDIFPCLKKGNRSLFANKISQQLCTLFNFDAPDVNHLISIIKNNMEIFQNKGYWCSKKMSHSDINYVDVWESIKYSNPPYVKFKSQTICSSFLSSTLKVNRLQSVQVDIALLIMPDKLLSIKHFITAKIPFGNNWYSWYLFEPHQPDIFYYLRDINVSLKYEDILKVSTKIYRQDLAEHMKQVTYSRMVPIIKKLSGMKQEDARNLSNEDKDRFLTLQHMQSI